MTAIGKNRILSIKSADRLFGVPSNFSINLSQYNLNPTYVSFHQIALPNGFYNITSKYNTAVIQIYQHSGLGVLMNSQQISVTVPPGNYTYQTLLSGTTGIGAYVGLIAQLNSAIKAAQGSSVSTTFFDPTLSGINPYTNQLVLAISATDATALWTFGVYGYPLLNNKLGFPADNGIVPPPGYSTLTTITAPGIVDLRTPPNIYVRTSLVTGNYLTAGGPESVLAVIQNTAVFGQTIFQRTLPDFEIFPVSARIGLVSFQLVDEYGQEVNMDSNQDYEITLAFFSL